MTRYDLYLESGPRRQRTMVHVGSLLGCSVSGPTTDAALEATPAAIARYRAFLRRVGETPPGDESTEVRVAEHVTEGQWLGHGSPYVTFKPDRKPVTAPDIESCVRRFSAMCEVMAAWTAGRTARQLDAAPRDRGRTARAVELHALGSPGAYISAALGGAPGFSRLSSGAERGDIDLTDAWPRLAELTAATLRGTSAEQRRNERLLSGGTRVYTLAKAVRRLLEHTWEHLEELAARPGGPHLS